MRLSFPCTGLLLALSVACATPLLAQPVLHDPDAVVTARPGAATPRGSAVLLDFEGLGNNEPVNDFYNGGVGGNGSSGGANFGIQFSSNSLAIIDADAGGSGNFGGEPSPDTILFFLTGATANATTGTAAVMNVPAGFSGGFSFFYTAISQPGVIRVFDGPNGTGTLLATLNLPLTPNNGAPDPTGTFSPLVPIGVTFSGTARSVDFGGTVNQIGFDNITLGSGTPIGPGGPPAPAIPAPVNHPLALLWMALAMALAGWVAVRRS